MFAWLKVKHISGVFNSILRIRWSPQVWKNEMLSKNTINLNIFMYLDAWATGRFRPCTGMGMTKYMDDTIYNQEGQIYIILTDRYNIATKLVWIYK